MYIYRIVLYIDIFMIYLFINRKGKVNRWLEINVEYQNTQGEKKSLELKGYAARIFQHEFDHLDKVYIYT
jgi:peptide deformylase